jgi:tetratricopeptide (TPR) repeat protein
MRPVFLLSLSLLAAAAAAAPSPPPPAITCASPAVARTYQRALRGYYGGKQQVAERDFRAAVRRDPRCAMAQWGLSRTLQKQGKHAEALAAAAEAEKLSPAAGDLEQRLISIWARSLRALDAPEAERPKQLEPLRRDADLLIALYPDEFEPWILRGELAESPVRAAPFYLAALQVEPSNPFGSVWKPVVPPIPTVPAKGTAATATVVGKEPGPVAAPAAKPPLFEGLGMLSYRITTTSPEAQAYFEQGLRCMHAYVVPAHAKNSACAAFQQAAALDPSCAMAYWGLSFCGGAPLSKNDAAQRAVELAQKNGTDEEKRITVTRLIELTGKEEAFFDALDGTIAAYPQDVELWVWRGRHFGGYDLGGGNKIESLPFQLGAHRLKPEHPAPNHELIHGYEMINRPALGWPFTEGFRRSAPNMPHANHMQAHLAMRLGRWQEAIDCTRASRRKSLEGFPELDASHHIDILIRALAHEGRFTEAFAEPKAYRDGLPWARLLQLKHDLDALAEWGVKRSAVNSPDGAYISALVHLERNDPWGARPFADKVVEQWKKNPDDLYRYSEVEGRYMVQTGKVDEGLSMLRVAADKAARDNGLHGWGGGSYMMEQWGIAALQAHRWDEAELAFTEAIAHEHGSILGALGLQIVAEQRRDSTVARSYAARAGAIWRGADPGAFDRQLTRLRSLASATVAARTR